MEQGAGTDKFAGQEARFFMSGRSTYTIRFNRLDVPSTRSSGYATLATSSLRMSSIPYRSIASRSRP